MFINFIVIFERGLVFDNVHDDLYGFREWGLFVNYFQILSIKTYVLCAKKESSLSETFLLGAQNICLTGKNPANHFGDYIFTCLLSYNSNVRYFEIKFLVPKTSN